MNNDENLTYEDNVRELTVANNHNLDVMQCVTLAAENLEEFTKLAEQSLFEATSENSSMQGNKFLFQDESEPIAYQGLFEDFPIVDRESQPDQEASVGDSFAEVTSESLDQLLQEIKENDENFISCLNKEDAIMGGAQLHRRAEPADENAIPDSFLSLDPIPEISQNPRPVQESFANQAKTLKGNLAHICPYCNLATQTKRNLLRHIQEQHFKLRPEFRCKYCDYKNYRRGNMLRHISIMHKLVLGREHVSAQEVQASDPKANPIANVGEEHYSSHGVMENSLHRLLQENRTFKCSICEYATDVKGHLNKHVARMHKEKMLPQCPICRRKFDRQEEVNQHVRESHCDHKNHDCTDCSSSFSSPFGLKRHIAEHHGSSRKEYSCHICEFVTCRKEHLVRHISCLHKDVPLMRCSHCASRHLTKADFDRHMARHR